MKFNFLPSKEFNENSKERFLAAFEARYPVPFRRSSEFILALRALAIVLVVGVTVFGGASVYADTKNVAADNPLYPLKRLSESVQLALTAPAAQPQLEASIAARRAGEITDLEERHPTSTLLLGLTKDLAKAVRASVDEGDGNENNNAAVNATSSENNASEKAAPENAAQSHGNGKQKGLEKVCETLQSFLSSSSPFMENGFLNSSETRQRFEDRCGTIISSMPSSSVSVTPVATSTIQQSEQKHGGENDQGEVEGVHVEVNVTSTMQTSTVQSGKRDNGDGGGDSESARGTGILDENFEF